jgi:hypothetical protein
MTTPSNELKNAVTFREEVHEDLEDVIRQFYARCFDLINRKVGAVLLVEDTHSRLKDIKKYERMNPDERLTALRAVAMSLLTANPSRYLKPKPLPKNGFRSIILFDAMKSCQLRQIPRMCVDFRYDGMSNSEIIQMLIRCRGLRYITGAEIDDYIELGASGIGDLLDNDWAWVVFDSAPHYNQNGESN